MGTPIDIEGEFEEGWADGRCFGPGKPLGPGHAPKYLCFEVKNIVACPAAPVPAPNGYWILEQDGGNPNIWKHMYGPYWFYFEYEPGVTFMWIYDSTVSFQWFFHDGGPACGVFMENWAQACPMFQYGKFGTVRLAYVKNPIAAEMLLEYNLNRQKNSFMETWPIEDGIEVARYANLQTPMNVKVKYDSNLAEIHLQPFGPD